MTGSGSGGDSLDADITFKCGTAPYRACTTDELNRQSRVKSTGRCTMTPASEACASFLMRNGSGQNPALRAGDPLSQIDDFALKCGKVPYRLCTADEERRRDQLLAQQRGAGGANPTAASASQDYGVSGGLIGPPCPPDICGGAGRGMSSDPPAFTKDEFQREMADARSDNPYPVIDLGDNRYGVVTPDGEVQVCGKGVCAGTRDPSTIPGYADKVQLARAEKTGFNASSGGGQTPVPVKSEPGASRSATSQPGADQDAADVAAAQGQIGRSVTNSSGAGPGWTGTGTASAGASGTASEVVKVDGSTIKVDAIEVTFEANQRFLHQLEATQRVMESGSVEALITTDGQTSAAKRGRIAEPPVDASVLGKQQFNANGTQPK
ncbi:MAG: hypothetical protein M0D55_04995 [Elusimicrobiota bacterium]|nr:MAG: hypothetical protein M0D55_04995 [Elusimicrobiota bacterium]